MSVVATFPSPGVASRPARSRIADLAVFVGAAVILWLVVRVGGGMAVPWTVAGAPSSVSTDPLLLPYYVSRSLLRMFAALGLSLLFTFFYATAAALADDLNRFQHVIRESGPCRPCPARCLGHRWTPQTSRWLALFAGRGDQPYYAGG